MDTKDIQDNSIRDYPLMEKIDRLYHTMTAEELKAAHAVIGVIAEHLYKKHFDYNIKINIKSLVKTFGELDEIGLEILHNRSSD